MEWLSKYDNGGKKKFLEPNDKKLPSGRIHPFYYQPSSELAQSIGGEEGEPAYLIPTFKYGHPLDNPLEEYKRTGEHLGGPFKTWQEADEWDKNIRHPYVEKNEALPSPLKRWGKNYENGGWLKKYENGGLVTVQNGKEIIPENPTFAPATPTEDKYVNPEGATLANTSAAEEARAWTKSMILSPKTKERLVNSGMTNEDANLEIGRRLTRVASVSFNNKIDGNHMLGRYNRDHTISLNPNPDTSILTATPVHELSHSSTTSYLQKVSNPFETTTKQQVVLPGSQLSNIAKGQSTTAFDYFNNPSEVKARLDELRYIGKDFYNAGTEDFTKEHLDRLKTLGPDALKGLHKTYNDDDIIRLMNEVAQNKSQKEQPIQTAENGGEMRYYQHGLDFKPKTISKNGSVVKDNLGYLNPDNFGKVVEIDSPNITMRNVPFDIEAVSDAGERKILKANSKGHVFKGTKVTEYPIARYGIEDLHQLQDFTNKPSTKNWLNKYNT